jgi:hypothetical protein
MFYNYLAKVFTLRLSGADKTAATQRGQAANAGDCGVAPAAGLGASVLETATDGWRGGTRNPSKTFSSSY